MEKLKKIVQDSIVIYKYFYKLAYKIEKRQLSSKDESTIEKCFEKICKLEDIYIHQIGRNYILRYCIFQFDYWYKLDVDKYKNGIPINWIFGSKSVDRWVSRNKEFDWTILFKEFLKTENINVSLNKIFDREPSVQLNQNEELEKKRYDDERRLPNCIIKTTLYSRRSRVCRKCPYSEECIEALSQLYPELHKRRMKI